MRLNDLTVGQKNLVLNIGIIVLALFIAMNIYKSQDKSLGALKLQKEAEGRKNEMLKTISATEKAYNAYREFLKKKESFSPLDTIAEIARNTGIRIISIQPSGETDSALYKRKSFTLSVAAKTYHDLGRFISKLEDSPDIYMVDSFNVKMKNKQRNKDSDIMSADLIITTILLKD